MKKLEQRKPIPKTTLSIVIPALNEEKNIEAAIRKSIRLSEKRFENYEIIAINDGSMDKTGEIIERMKKENKHIVAVHHESPWGLGGTYRDGLSKAKYKYFSLLAGDNEELEEPLKTLYDNVSIGDADVVLSYTVNSNVRALDRQIISKLFTIGMNLLFCLNVPYYSGANIIKTKLLQSLPMRTAGFAYMPSIVVRVAKMGCVFRKVPMMIQKSGKSNIYKWKNVWSIIKEIITLFIEVNITKRSKFSKKPTMLN